MRQIDRLYQRHSEGIGVEIDRSRHVPADECDVIDSSDFEFVIFGNGHGLLAICIG
jgi:hypothetical protein